MKIIKTRKKWWEHTTKTAYRWNPNKKRWEFWSNMELNLRWLVSSMCFDYNYGWDYSIGLDIITMRLDTIVTTYHTTWAMPED